MTQKKAWTSLCLLRENVGLKVLYFNKTFFLTNIKLCFISLTMSINLGLGLDLRVSRYGQKGVIVILAVLLKMPDSFLKTLHALFEIMQIEDIDSYLLISH